MRAKSLNKLLITSLAMAMSVVSLPPMSLTSSPSADAAKVVVAHFMVANTFHYTPADWVQDIALAASSGLDAFALNIGNGEWYLKSVAAAYTAALQYPNFKLFISFDMTSIPCSSSDDANAVYELIAEHRTHPNQLYYKGAPLASTFGGEYCRFGTGSVNEGWSSVMKRSLGFTFIPCFFIPPETSKDYSVLDGIFPWNSAWPLGPTDISFDYDKAYISGLRIGQSYMAGVSPWFFTHYGPGSYNKNFIFRGDDWLLATRMEQLFEHRSEIGLVEVITWNDYGESHYIGPIHGDQPDSQGWVNGFDHQAWLPLLSYYITAFKTGAYSPTVKERIFLWMRPHPTAASAPDPVGKPANAQWTEDYLWVVALLAAPGDITLSCGPSNEATTSFTTPGPQKAKLLLKADCRPHAAITRGGVPIVVLEPEGVSFTMTPERYNFNAYVASSW